MDISTEQVKQLREETGVSVMQCRKALEEAAGDMEKARVILRKKSKEQAEKKGDRTLGAGVIASYIHTTGKVGAMVTLLCETDFVAKNEEFKTLARDIAMQVAAAAPAYNRKENVTEDEKKAALEVLAKEVEVKPEEMKEKILAGKLDAYFKDKILLEQSFIKNPEVTIGGLLDSAVQKFGEKVAISSFTRYEV